MRGSRRVEGLLPAGHRVPGFPDGLIGPTVAGVETHIKSAPRRRRADRDGSFVNPRRKGRVRREQNLGRTICRQPGAIVLMHGGDVYVEWHLIVVGNTPADRFLLET